MEILDVLSEKIKESFLAYSLALILTTEKKVCTKMARFLNKSHDYLQRFLNNYGLLIPIFPQIMFAIANHHAKDKRGYLIIDDTTMSKPFAKFIAGIYTIYNTAMSRPDKGFNLVVIAWSNGNVTIPLMFQWYFDKGITGEHFRSKSEIAIDLISRCIGKVAFCYILFDGHYSTVEMLKFLLANKLKFVAKIPCNRKVTAKSIFDQIRNLPQLKFIRNERHKSTVASFHGMRFYFSSHKREKKTGGYNYIYIISNMAFSAKTYMKLYNQRWSIEEMFRTMKQLLGFANCQSKELEKQKTHVFSVFFSYSFLESVKHNKKLKNAEEAVTHLRELKLNGAAPRITAFGENFQCFA